MNANEDYKTRLKKYHVQYCKIIFILLCLIFSRFLIPFIYIIKHRVLVSSVYNIETIRKALSATSTFKCWGPLQLYLFVLFCFPDKRKIMLPWTLLFLNVCPRKSADVKYVTYGQFLYFILQKRYWIYFISTSHILSSSSCSRLF